MNNFRNDAFEGSPSKYNFQTRLQQRLLTNSLKNDFAFKAVIGEGRFGLVYLATHNPDRMEYAVKTWDKEAVVREGKVANVYREKQLLMALSNPFVISCSYYFADDRRIYLATPYMSGGDLYGYIMWSGQTPNEDTAKFFVAQILLALEYLHTLRIIHRDLKPENAMLDHRGYVKLIDLECCSVCKNVNFTICGTIQYMAPEMLLGSGYGGSVDYWSLGVLTYELSCFELPFDARDQGILGRTIMEGKYSVKKGFSNSLKDLLSHLLDVNPVTRYGFKAEGVNSIKSHSWFRDIDFNRLYNRSVDPPKIMPLTPVIKNRPFQLLKECTNVKYFKEFEDF